MYVKQRRLREAEATALTAYKGYSQRLGDANASTREVISLLATVYEQMNQPGNAAEWHAKLSAPRQ